MIIPEKKILADPPLLTSERISLTVRAAESTWKHRARSLLLLFLLLALSGCSREGKFRQYPVFYDFVENFPLAEVQQEVSLIDFGTPAAHPHLIRGWSHDEKMPNGKLTYVWSFGESSVLEFFLSEPREIQVAFRCFPFQFAGAPKQIVFIAINGKDLGQVTVEPELKEYQIDLPRLTVVAGKNRLEFRYAYARAPREVKPGANDPRVLAVWWDYIRFGLEDKQVRSEPRADVKSDELYIPFGAQVDYYLKLPREGVFTLDGLTVTGNPAGQLSLILQREGTEEQVLKNLTASENFRSIPLSRDGAKIVRVSLQAVSPEPHSAASDGVMLVKPAIRSRGLSEDPPAGAPSRRSLAAASTRKPNVIIYLIDTLRADHLGCYGYEKPISPNIDAFARDAVLFKTAIAQSPWTKSSVASIFTGLYPATHGANEKNDILAVEANTLAEILRSGDYQTAAFITNANVGQKLGFNQGFVDFVEFAYLAKAAAELSDALNVQIFAWLKKKGNQQPFFLYIHSMDPHSPYSPPNSFRKRFARRVRELQIGSSRSWLDQLAAKRFPVTNTLIESLVSLYDAEIAFNDQQFGFLLDELKRKGLYEESLIILVSDHGEEFYEHGGWEHAKTFYREVLNVPLIVKFPSSSGIGKMKISHMTQHIDILPTVLEYLGLQIPEYAEGRSLIPYLSLGRDNRKQRERAFSYLDFDEKRGDTIIDGQWKLIRMWKYRREMGLYNREHDPNETVDVFDKHPVIARYLLSLLKAHERDHRQGMKSSKIEIDEDLRKKLKALGYVQ